jgi:3-deoxy-manno-octulosonate cytidylyltransferase (CMP-KDO synthetase)
MNVAIVLPARLKSTRLPNKLLLNRTGKTLLEHSIDRAKLAQAAYPKLFTTIRVACDDEQLIVAAKRAGVDAVMTDRNHQSGTDRIAEAAKDLKEEIIVNLQADEPEIELEYVRKVAELLQRADTPAVMGTLATFIYDETTFRNPNVVKVVVDDIPTRAIYFSRAPIPYSREGLPYGGPTGKHVYGLHHIGIYSYRHEFLNRFVTLPQPSRLEQVEKLEQLRALENGATIGIALVPKHFPGIDTPEDYEAFLQRQKSGPKN